MFITTTAALRLDGLGERHEGVWRGEGAGVEGGCLRSVSPRCPDLVYRRRVAERRQRRRAPASRFPSSADVSPSRPRELVGRSVSAVESVRVAHMTRRRHAEKPYASARR